MTENKKNKKVYISLPISGLDLETRKDVALRAEIQLRGLGYDVFNPLGDGWVAGLSQNEYMKRDLKALLDCDAIYMMKGWNHTLNCKLELDNAIAIGIDVWFEGMNDIKL